MSAQPHSPYSARRLWTVTKIWVALRDVPEVGMLACLACGALGMGLYTFQRMYFTTAGEAFPSVEVRKDPELQMAVAARPVKPSMFYRIAQWKSDDKGYNMGIFDNRYRPYEYNMATPGDTRTGRPYEGSPAASNAAPL